MPYKNKCLLLIVFWFASMNLLPNPMSWRFPPKFSSRSLAVSGLTFKLFIHFELTLVCGIKWGSKVICLHVAFLVLLCVLGGLAEGELTGYAEHINTSKPRQVRWPQTKTLLHRRWNNRVKRQPRERENILANHKPDKGFTSKITKSSYNLIAKQTNKQNQKTHKH